MIKIFIGLQHHAVLEAPAATAATVVAIGFDRSLVEAALKAAEGAETARCKAAGLGDQAFPGGYAGDRFALEEREIDELAEASQLEARASRLEAAVDAERRLGGEEAGHYPDLRTFEAEDCRRRAAALRART